MLIYMAPAEDFEHSCATHTCAVAVTYMQISRCISTISKMTRAEFGMQEIMVDYVVQTMEKAIDSAISRGGKPTTEDVIFLVRKVSCPNIAHLLKGVSGRLQVSLVTVDITCTKQYQGCNLHCSRYSMAKAASGAAR